jgi:thiosulfate/3-mercaptopyruvate sulfurtransferase
LKSALGLEGDEEVISFCNTGHWAATHWFALSELAGIENSKLYAASMVEYSNFDLPMENTPGIFKNLLRQIGF